MAIPSRGDPRSDPRWRKRLQMASFKGAPFYVEQQGRSSGRRTVVHEYPKRDMPYAEDMGRHALRYQMTGYLIQAPPAASGQFDRFANLPLSENIEDRRTEVQQFGVQLSRRPPPAYRGNMPRDYDTARDQLEARLMEKSPGVLLDPHNPELTLTGYTGQGPLLFMCERYTIVESRERGGFATLDMSFVEAGIPGNNQPQVDTAGSVNTAADAATDAAGQSLDQQLGIEDIGRNP